MLNCHHLNHLLLVSFAALQLCSKMFGTRHFLHQMVLILYLQGYLIIFIFSFYYLVAKLAGYLRFVEETCLYRLCSLVEKRYCFILIKTYFLVINVLVDAVILVVFVGLTFIIMVFLADWLVEQPKQHVTT